MLAKKRKGATEKREGSSGIVSLLWMFIGSILTLMIGLFLYLWNPFNTGEETTTTETRRVEPRANNTTTTKADEYEFYDLLPQQEVSSIPDEAVAGSNGDALSDTDRALQQVLLDSEIDVVVTAADEPTASEDSGSTEDMVAATGDGEVVIVEEQGTYDGTESSDTGNNAGALTTDNNSTANGTTSNDKPVTDDIAVATTQANNNITSSGSTNSNNINSSNSADSQAEPAKATVAPHNTYILQINSFSSAEEADGRRAQVLMAGVDAQVVKKELPNGQVFYQVVTPPMRNRQAIALEQQRLQNNGIDSLIVEQRR